MEHQNCTQCGEKLPMIQRQRGLHEFCLKAVQRQGQQERPETEFDKGLKRYQQPA
jgi:hypothetical protein